MRPRVATYLFIATLLSFGPAPAADCNQNGIEDAEDIAAGESRDCNENGIPDECEIAADGLLFEVTQTVKVGSSPVAVKAGDLDGDGDMDLVSLNYGSDSLSVLLNDGAGSFSVKAAIDLGASAQPVAVVAGDLDSDGDLDLAVSNLGGKSVTVLLNNGGGSFFKLPPYPLTEEPYGMDIADLDGDGDLDLVAVGGRRAAWIFENDGEAQFVMAPCGASEYPNRVRAVDLDLDGRLDLVSTGNKFYSVPNTGIVASGRAAVLWNEAAPGTLDFSGSVVYLPAPEGSAFDLDAGDIDGDGDVDLVAASLKDREAWVWVNEGDRVFAQPSPLAPGACVEACALADADGDGALDLLLAGCGNMIWRYSNDASGNFEYAGWSAAGEYPNHVEAVDVDGDGQLDLIASNEYSNDISILCGRIGRVDNDCNGNGVPDACDIAADPLLDGNGDGIIDSCTPLPTFIRGDVNGDIAIDICDAAFLSGYLFGGVGIRPACMSSADLNNEGHVDISDTVCLLNYLFLDTSSLTASCLDLAGCGPRDTSVPAVVADVALGFEGCPEEISGVPGEVKTLTVRAMLTTSGNESDKGALAWSLGIVADKAAISSITFDGTDLGGLLGFSVAELATGGLGACAGCEGAVSAVLCDVLYRRWLPPNGTAAIAVLEIAVTIPEEESTAELRYVDGCRGSGQSVKNVVSFEGTNDSGQKVVTSHVPVLGRTEIRLVPVAGGRFQRGDPNANAEVDIADAIFLLSYLFAQGAEPSCLDAGDTNDSGQIDIADAIAVLSHLFAQAGPLPAPFGECGADPTDDALECGAYAPCE